MNGDENRMNEKNFRFFDFQFISSRIFAKQITEKNTGFLVKKSFNM